MTPKEFAEKYVAGGRKSVYTDLPHGSRVRLPTYSAVSFMNNIPFIDMLDRQGMTARECESLAAVLIEAATYMKAVEMHLTE